ncbi:hypothetical protein PMCN03_0936 [Pasteurella multocida subsp. multocida str. HB03]|nr:hypothetical protein PMCN03_0936 [Pasteurella multocida subsp. multocida str. HB03]
MGPLHYRRQDIRLMSSLFFCSSFVLSSLSHFNQKQAV